jgi:hypothetical protein
MTRCLYCAIQYARGSWPSELASHTGAAPRENQPKETMRSFLAPLATPSPSRRVAGAAEVGLEDKTDERSGVRLSPPAIRPL